MNYKKRPKQRLGVNKSASQPAGPAQRRRRRPIQRWGVPIPDTARNFAVLSFDEQAVTSMTRRAQAQHGAEASETQIGTFVRAIQRVFETARMPGRDIERTIEHEFPDERGKWLLSAHDDHHCEYPLTGLEEGRFRSVVLDRTFVDKNGTRWIIDYKTSRHEGADLDGFLDNEQVRYQEQMQLYGKLLSTNESRPIRLALYFPLLGGWREWAYDAG